ncbi:universal stress protein [Neolewinella litorea]|uniref:Universal stress protein n=1 Tax=Neolewinella litorea TaxID=2562452 RepID=A0A4S4NKH3_9BACT|nr:universal stress protein [Neolewinella litorea]THH40299.1 universal stress protein [Neolewinella litorea]
MKRIIVPVDFSPTSAAATRFGTHLAETMKMDLTVLHVYDTRLSTSQTISTRAKAREQERMEDQLDKFTRRNVEPVLATFQGRLDVLPAVKSMALEGRAARKILRISKAADVGLIVMGGVGAGAGLHPPGAFGSVASRVALRGGCPVILIPKDYGAPPVERLALAFNSVNDVRYMRGFTQKIVRALHPEVRFVHVNAGSKAGTPEQQEEFRKLADEPGFPSRTYQLDFLGPGPVVKQLLTYTEEEEIDLLILGGERRGFLERLLIPAHLRPLVHRCTVPVLIIPFQSYAL